MYFAARSKYMVLASRFTVGELWWNACIDLVNVNVLRLLKVTVVACKGSETSRDLYLARNPETKHYNLV